MWMREGQLERARVLFAAAHERQTAYVYATAHLGEVEAALGKTPDAIRHLTTAAAAEDPDPAAELARVLAKAGRESEAAPFRARATSRYRELGERHPEAFADHAAEFWLGAGGDPIPALAWARKNLEVRRTPWAWLLAGRAALAAGDSAFACNAAEQALAFHHATPDLARLARNAAQACGRTLEGS